MKNRLDLIGPIYGCVRMYGESDDNFKQRIINKITIRDFSLQTKTDYILLIQKFKFKKYYIVENFNLHSVTICVHFFFLNISGWVRFFKMKKIIKNKAPVTIKIILKRIWWGKEL